MENFTISGRLTFDGNNLVQVMEHMRVFRELKITTGYLSETLSNIEKSITCELEIVAECTISNPELLRDFFKSIEGYLINGSRVVTRQDDDSPWSWVVSLYDKPSYKVFQTIYTPNKSECINHFTKEKTVY